MSSNSGQIIVGLVVGNLVYALGFFILAAFFQYTPTSVLQGPFAGTYNSLFNSYLVLGGILGAVDCLVVLGPIMSIVGAGSR